MPRSVRKVAALLVAYSIALQVLFLGFVLGEHAGSDPFAVSCTSDAASDHNVPLQQHGSDCSACPLACGGSPGVLPSSQKLGLMLFANQAPSLALWAKVPPLPAKHQPQAARAPPMQG
jgi:hypothetical protein